MSPTAAADLEDDLRVLFTDQAASLSPIPPDLDALDRIDVEPGGPARGRRPAAIRIVSVAAALVLVLVAATLALRDQRTDVTTGGVPSPALTNSTDPPDPADQTSSSVVENEPAPKDLVPGILDPQTYLAAMSDDAFERMLATLPAEQQPAIRAMRDQYRGGRVRVGGPDGIMGWLSVEGYQAPAATSIEDLYPVVDDDGTIVLYWTRSIGGIPKAAVEAVPAPTLDELETRYAPKILCDRPTVDSEPSPEQQRVIDRARAQGRCMP